jgi:hypothetical protein
VEVALEVELALEVEVTLEGDVALEVETELLWTVSVDRESPYPMFQDPGETLITGLEFWTDVAFGEAERERMVEPIGKITVALKDVVKLMAHADPFLLVSISVS